MNSDSKKYYIVVNGERVPVSEQVYRAYHHYQRKEEYFTYDLKAERFICDFGSQTAFFVPSREDSYERLLDLEQQFAADGIPLDEQVADSDWMDTLLDVLDPKERHIIRGIFIEQRTEQDLGTELHVSQNTVHYWKKKALKKLRKILEKNL